MKSTRVPLTLRVPASCRPGQQDKSKRLFSESVEEYVDCIYRLQREVDEVSTGEIAQYMFVSPSSATTMVKKLAELGLVRHVPYQGIQLTEHGSKLAIQLTRAHRVLKSFLVGELDMPWSDVHELACKLEHYIGDDVIDRMHAKMGRPSHDPHGAPIDPTAPEQCQRLESASAGALRVVKITDERVEFLAHLEQLGLKPGKEFVAAGSTRIDNLIHLEIDGAPYTVGPEVARHLWVEPV